MKLIIYPKYSSMGPSSRYRIYEYLPYFDKMGINYSVKPLLGDWYLCSVWQHKGKSAIALKLMSAYLKRILSVLFLSRNSIVYIGAELLPSFPGWMEKYLKLRGIEYIIEFDDAVFHMYDLNKRKIIRDFFKKKFEKVIRDASVVICGCQYLAEYSKQWNSNVVIIPTCIDGEKYNVPLHNKEKIVIGWIGSSSSSWHIEIVVEALKKLKKDIEYELHLVGFDEKYEHLLTGLNYKIKKWSKDTEIIEMSKFSIGIMPLIDNPLSRGKCAFKLVQYMAMGIPTISTPLQSNVDIDKGCGNLFASSDDEWYEAFKLLLTDSVLREQIGSKNKEISMKYYTFQSTYMEKIEIFERLGLIPNKKF